jgi:hypothetical protein
MTHLTVNLTSRAAGQAGDTGKFAAETGMRAEIG